MRILDDTVAGALGSESNAGTARCPGMIALTPARIAARNGTSSFCSSSSRLPGTVAKQDGNRRSHCHVRGNVSPSRAHRFPPRRAQTPDVPAPLPADLAKRPDVDDRIIEIVVDVRIGREDPVDARGARLHRCHLASHVGEFWIACRGNRHRGRKCRAFLQPHARTRFESAPIKSGTSRIAAVRWRS